MLNNGNMGYDNSIKVAPPVHSPVTARLVPKGVNAQKIDKLTKLPARIELATFRLRSERTTTMLRKHLNLIIISSI
jgi:hypothetical protein